MARALRFHAHLPFNFWGECMLTTAYLIKRLHTPLLAGKSPYELLFNRPPIYKHLCVFYCLCYATNLHPSHKFDKQARKYIFVGYPFGQKAYRIYELETKKFFSSRDVIFHENVFPFANQHDVPTIPILPLPPNDYDYELVHISYPLPTSSSKPNSPTNPDMHTPSPDTRSSTPTPPLPDTLLPSPRTQSSPNTHTQFSPNTQSNISLNLVHHRFDILNA